MARKKSVKKSATTFKAQVDEISTFVELASQGLSGLYQSWIYEYGILRLYREFEVLMLDALVGAINNDTATISDSTGISFPKHLTDEVCEYLIVGNGYFDFKGRDGLIQVLKSYVPNDHYLLDTVRKNKYKPALEQLSAFRNLAAHNSTVAKLRARSVVDQKRIPAAGAWLKRQGRFETLVARLKELADDIHHGAPF